MKSIITQLLFILLAFSLESYAQSTPIKYERTITVSQFIKEITVLNSDSAIKLEKVNIVADTGKDIRYLYGAGSYGRQLDWDSITANYPIIEVDNDVFLFKIRFGQRTVLPKIHFKKKLHVEGVDVYGDLDFRHCTFDGSVYILRPDSYFLGFYNCTFNQKASFEEVLSAQFYIEKSAFNKTIWIYNIGKAIQLNISNSKFTGTANFGNTTPGSLSIHRSTFNPISSKSSVKILSSSFNELILVDNTFNMPFWLSGTSVKENLTLMKCKMSDKNDFSSISLPESNTYARWTQFEKYKFGVSLNDSTFYNGKNVIDTTTQDEYYALIKIYSQFLRAYKNNGDQESYNDCYIEMKDIQTRKAAFNFKEKPTLNNYFEWKFNRFLKIFCDYGTNPVKSLIFSVYIILFFGFLYFIFPSEGKIIEWRRLYLALKNRKKHTDFIKKELFTGLKQLTNAIALSMNAFVTLGYGEMPARGVARYLAVFEGLTGWLLLSIFSASLISQMLQ